MFTFQAQKTDPIFFIDDKPVYTTFNKDPKLRIAPFSGDTFLSSDAFLERYSLSKREGEELKTAIRNDQAPDNQLKQKFYAVRKDLNQRLYTTIDLRGTDKKITWRFPENVNAWPTTQILIGSSGVGKTYKIVQEITEALQRRKKRKFVYVSPEFNRDDTLKKLRNSQRYKKYFQGIDIGDEAFETWREGRDNTGNDEEWWESIRQELDKLSPGTFVVLDDSPDSLLAPYLRPWLNKMLRTGRHKGIGVGSLQHSIRGARFTSQSYSSCKWVHLFPRGGGKGLQVDFLNEQQGVPRRRARELIELFGDTGRWMTIHQWSPPVLYGPKFAVFL